MTNFIYWKNQRFLLCTLFFAICLITARANETILVIQKNIGMRMLAFALASNSPTNSLLYAQHSINYLEAVADKKVSNSDASLLKSLGFARWINNNNAEAVSIWKTVPHITDDFVTRAHSLEKAGNHQQSLYWVNIAKQVDDELSAQSFIAEANQKIAEKRYEQAVNWLDTAVTVDSSQTESWFWLGLLSQFLQLNNRGELDKLKTYSAKFAQWNNQNEIINHKFTVGKLGWLTHPQTESNTFQIQKANHESYGIIRSSSENFRGGWLQRLNLEEGKVYRYQALIRTQGVSDFKVFPLYWENVDVMIKGHFSVPEIYGDNDTYLYETMITIPFSSEGIAFYPVLVEGGPGTVWITDVIVSEQ